MEISVMADKEQEKRLIMMLAQVACEADKEESDETSGRVLPCIDCVE